MRYYKDIANLLFWELWKCLTIPIKIILSICSKFSCLPACKKIDFIIHIFLEILQKNSFYFEHFILGNWDLSVQTDLKWQYHLEKPFDNYLQAKTIFILYICFEVLQSLWFWVLWTCLAIYTQKDTINL